MTNALWAALAIHDNARSKYDALYWSLYLQLNAQMIEPLTNYIHANR